MEFLKRCAAGSFVLQKCSFCLIGRRHLLLHDCYIILQIDETTQNRRSTLRSAANNNNNQLDNNSNTKHHQQMSNNSVEHMDYETSATTSTDQANDLEWHFSQIKGNLDAEETPADGVFFIFLILNEWCRRFCPQKVINAVKNIDTFKHGTCYKIVN